MTSRAKRAKREAKVNMAINRSKGTLAKEVRHPFYNGNGNGNSPKHFISEERLERSRCEVNKF